MFTWIFGVMLAFAAADWLASWRGWREVRYVTKPVTLILLIAWFTQVGGWRGGLAWFGLGLVFSLVGDVMLMLPPRFFLAGVGGFLLAHLAYIAGFLQIPPPLHWLMLPMIALVGAAFWALNRRIRRGLREKGETKLVVPVMIYAVVLSLMLLAALTTLFHPTWTEPPALLVSLGALFFFISDSVLANNRFVRLIPNADLIVMFTYHVGQILIAAGALGQFAGMLYSG